MIVNKMTVIVLALACFLQGEPSGHGAIQQSVPDATKQVPPAKDKSLTVTWQMYIPSVACDDGTPVVNFELPDKNAPVPICPGQKPLDLLPERGSVAENISADADYEVGTVIAVGISREKITIAADSRNTLFSTRLRADGTQEVTRTYDDSACKLTQLTPTLLFAADGQTSSTIKSFPANALYDAHKLARLAAENYRANPASKNSFGNDGMIAEIAQRWAWDIDFRMHRAFANGWVPIQTLEGIFVGLEPNGETAMIVAKLDYPKPRQGFTVPKASFTIAGLSSSPTDFTWIQAFGMNDVARSYYSARAVTEETKAESKLINIEALKDPKAFNNNVPERLVDLTIQHYQALVGPDDLLLVHGPIDSAVIEKNKGVKWIHSKKCSGVNP